MAKKVAPFVRDPDVKRALNELYNDINKILASIEIPSYNSIQSSLGKVGDIKAIKDSKDGSYKISGKTKYGWISSPAYLHTGNKGRRVNIPEFNLHNDEKVKYDKGELNIFSPIASSLKLGSSIDYFKIATTSEGSTTIATNDNDGSNANLTLAIDGDIILNADGGDVTIADGTADDFWKIDATNRSFRFQHDDANYFKIEVAANGVTTMSTVDEGIGTAGNFNLNVEGVCTITGFTSTSLVTTIGDITIDPGGGDTIISGSTLKIDSTKGLYFDGGGDTYIAESSDDVIRLVVGGDVIMHIAENGADGNQVAFLTASVGFTQLEPTYDATTTIVDFRHSNKQHLTFDGGNITNVSMYFPEMSGNFQLLIKQDGTGGRTVTNQYRVYEFDESTADGDSLVKFAGGSNPTLTTDANHVDIISFYWDNDNEIAYGVATLDFQF